LWPRAAGLVTVGGYNIQNIAEAANRPLTSTAVGANGTSTLSAGGRTGGEPGSAVPAALGCGHPLPL
jgi:hypothetical protein